jgi:hypothetical protein
MNLLRRLRGPAIDEEGVLAVVYSYYLDPQPARALAAFERLVESGAAEPARAEMMMSAAWVFGRIAEQNPGIQGAVRRALERRRVTTSTFGRMVLDVMEAGEGATQKLLTRPLTSAMEIALLEAEVVATGSLDPYVWMIDALQAPDIVRRVLEAWLQSEGGYLISPSVEAGIEVLATDYHIVARADPPSVLTVSDCDLMVMIQKPLSIRVTKQGLPTPPLRHDRPLPAEPSADHSEPLRIKLSAYVALANGLNEHDGLLDLIRSEFARREDVRVRIDLLELLAGYALPKFRIAQGIELLEQVLELDPYRPDLATLLERLRRDPFDLMTGG